MIIKLKIDFNSDVLNICYMNHSRIETIKVKNHLKTQFDNGNLKWLKKNAF